ncbi:hypothetical protein IFM89_010266, partial [Coptis chinensis]
MKLGFESNPVLGSALVDFYSKCGYFLEAFEIFQATDCGDKFKLIDTGGIRRRAVVVLFGNITEALSVNRVLQAIRCADVVDLVIEALACRIERDYKIAERIKREGKGCVTVVNKWDTIPNKKLQTASYYEEDVRERLRSLNWAPIVYSIAM